VRVENFDEAVDIETGEEIEQYPPSGWIPVGSSHSHNTMQAFFSGIDDKYELDDPGIHLVIGSVDTKNMKYTIASSVVGSRRRFELPYDNLVDATPVEGVNFHPKVIDYVDWSTPTVVTPKKSGGSFLKVPTQWTKKVSDTPKNNFNSMEYWGWNDSDDYNDPFYWNTSYSNKDDDMGLDSVKIWHITDTLNDFMNQNKTEVHKLNNLREELYDFLSDLEVLLDSQIEQNFEELIESNVY
jgi:hypothetical protein